MLSNRSEPIHLPMPGRQQRLYPGIEFWIIGQVEINPDTQRREVQNV